MSQPAEQAEMCAEAQPIGSDAACRAEGESHLVTLHLALVRQNDREALERLWDRYFPALVRYTARLAGASRLPDQSVEAIALDAFMSFWTSASNGGYGDLADRDEFWALLSKIARRKLAHRNRDAKRLKRGGGKVMNESDVPDGDAGSYENLLDRFEGKEPSPEDAAFARELLELLRAALPDASLRDAFEMKAQGYSHDAIAQALQCSSTTVGRRMAEVRLRMAELANSDEE